MHDDKAGNGALEHFEALLDGCDGDADGLKVALGEGYEVLRSFGDDSIGYGHHSSETIYRAHDGRIIHAECGGCSCGGSCSWSYCKTEADAVLLVSEYLRDDEVRA